VRAPRAAAALLVAAAAGWLGCATCRPDQPPVRPSVGASIGGGTGGFYHSSGVGLDVTNLFCRAPQSAQTGEAPQPTQTPVPGTPPIEDPKPPADAPNASGPPADAPRSSQPER